LRERDGVLGDDRLARRRVRCDKHRLADLHVVDGLLLERVELEWVLRARERGRRGTSVSGEREDRARSESATHLASHVRHELVEVDDLAVDVNDVRPVALGDDGSSAS